MNALTPAAAIAAAVESVAFGPAPDTVAASIEALVSGPMLEPVAPPAPPSVTLERTRLCTAIATAARFAPKKSSVPVLECIKLTFDGGALSAIATDLDKQAIATIPATGGQAFAAVVSAPALAKILAKAPKGETVTLSRDFPDNAPLRVTIGAATYDLESEPVADFPVPNPGDGWHTVLAETREAAALFSRIAFAMSDEQTRYYINGAYLHPAAPYGTRNTSLHLGPDPDGRFPLRTVATDGHRLGHYDSAIRVPADFPALIVPRDAVLEIVRHLSAKGAAPLTEIQTSATRTRITCGDISIETKAIDGTFPDYTRVMPCADDIARLCPAGLDSALAGIEPVRDRGTVLAKLTCLDIVGDAVTLSAKGDIGAASQPIEGYALSRDTDHRAAFDAAYLKDVARAFKGAETIRFAQESVGDPARFEVDGDGLTVVLMPMRRP